MANKMDKATHNASLKLMKDLELRMFGYGPTVDKYTGKLFDTLAKLKLGKRKTYALDISSIQRVLENVQFGSEDKDEY